MHSRILTEAATSVILSQDFTFSPGPSIAAASCITSERAVFGDASIEFEAEVAGWTVASCGLIVHDPELDRVAIRPAGPFGPSVKA